MTSTPPPDLATRLLAVLEGTGPQPALAWYGESARIELSGHVLANWVIKAIGHLEGELAVEPGDEIVLDLPPHWKRLVLALAGWSLGAAVHAAGSERAPARPGTVATDRPDSSLAEGAEEVLALEAISLSPRFGGQLPPLAHDWAAEVRAFPDQLGVVLPPWSGPAAETAPLVEDPPAPAHGPDASVVPRLLVPGDGLEEMPHVLGAWLAGGGIVGPAPQVDAQQAREEGVTARA